MSTLLIRFSAPMQAWGTEPRFDKWIRTGMEPSKSGVIGLVAAAMGIDRTDDIAIKKLTDNIRFGVRVDREGKIGTDYHAVRIIPKEECDYKDGFKTPLYINGSIVPESAIGRYDYKKYYLMDAAFTVGLESSDEAFIAQIMEALRHPKRFLFLGRKSCPLTEELDPVIKDMELTEALTDGLEEKADRRYHSYRILYDAKPGEAATMVNDNPVSFNSRKKVWNPRMVVETMVEVFPVTERHDPFACI